jgi:hypothetical protein
MKTSDLSPDGYVHVSVLMGEAWPIVAYHLTQRVCVQAIPPSPKRPLSPFNPGDQQGIDEQFPRLVRSAMQRLKIPIAAHEGWMSHIDMRQWKQICHGLAQAVDQTSDRYPEWPEGWRASFARARSGDWKATVDERRAEPGKE